MTSFTREYFLINCSDFSRVMNFDNAINFKVGQVLKVCARWERRKDLWTFLSAFEALNVFSAAFWLKLGQNPVIRNLRAHRKRWPQEHQGLKVSPKPLKNRMFPLKWSFPPPSTTECQWEKSCNQVWQLLGTRRFWREKKTSREIVKKLIFDPLVSTQQTNFSG